jgi:hypothetical protein
MDTFELVGSLNVRSRRAYRTFSAVQLAQEHHKSKGYDLTPIDPNMINRVVTTLALHKWAKIDILRLCDGFRLPNCPGLYGFFNLDVDALPTDRILYIGMSTTSLATRVTKSHAQYCKALRYKASHICFYLNRNPNEYKRNYSIKLGEIAMIQYWAPYLNRAENIFNYEVEDLRF